MKSQHFISTRVLLGLLLLITGQIVRAGSATWNFNPTSSDWNTAANWTPDTVPNGPTDIATLATSNTTDISISQRTDLDSLVFSRGREWLCGYDRPRV